MKYKIFINVSHLLYIVADTALIHLVLHNQYFDTDSLNHKNIIYLIKDMNVLKPNYPYVII